MLDLSTSLSREINSDIINFFSKFDLNNKDANIPLCDLDLMVKVFSIINQTPFTTVPLNILQHFTELLNKCIIQRYHDLYKTAFGDSTSKRNPLPLLCSLITLQLEKFHQDYKRLFLGYLLFI